jgi:hypothetical protein
MVKPFMHARKDYQPPKGWVEFSTLLPGAKFHNAVESGLPTQCIKLQDSVQSDVGGVNAVNLDTGGLVWIDSDEFVWPIDWGWISEISCYGIEISDEIKAKGHRAILAHVFSQCARAKNR